MTLIIDKRSKLKTNDGLHIFISGISDYKFLPKCNESPTSNSYGLRQLSSAALSSFRVYQWLINHEKNFPLPIVTCRLLLSPSQDECVVEPNLKGLVDRCTLDNFIDDANAWREDASSNDGNVTFFYFSGHGVQRTREDSVMLLEEFGKSGGGPLRYAVDSNNIFYGMAQSGNYPHMAQTQFYFIDTCRDFLQEFKKLQHPLTTDVFPVSLPSPDLRKAPMYFAAAPGTSAYGIKTNKQTFFSKALLKCLENDAGVLETINGQEKWHVSANSLHNALELIIDDLNTRYSADQYYHPGGLFRNAIINFLDSPPSVKVVLEIHPDSALHCTNIEVLDDSGNKYKRMACPLHPHPYECRWPAGVYTINAYIDPPNNCYIDCAGKARMIKPPIARRKMKVIP